MKNYFSLEIPEARLAMPTMSRFLFLDFDGVLHPADAHAALESVRVPLVDLRAAGLFVHVELLAELLSPYPDVGLVAHTSWRLTHSDAELRELLGPAGVRLVGATDRALDRESSILEFVRRRRLDVHQYRVLDDQAELMPRLVDGGLVIRSGSEAGLAAVDSMVALRAWLAGGMEKVLAENVEFTHWSPELRRAVMSVRPDFFGLPSEQRLRYRVDMPDEDRQAIVLALLKANGHVDAEKITRRESYDTVPVELKNRINEWLQPLVGIGEDAFSLNESFEAGKSILDSPTLLDYDKNDHAYQEKARSAVDPGYLQRPYAGTLHATWGRCMVGGRLCYLTLSMLALHLEGAMEEAADEEIERLIPHRYVPGPRDGSVEDGLVQLDLRLDAGGQERMLEELQSRVWNFLAKRRDELLIDFRDHPLNATYLVENPFPDVEADEQNLLVIFSDPSVLERIRFASFLSDCRALAQPREGLALVEARETKRMIEYVNEQHLELVRTFDPKVVHFRRRRKVMMHPKTFQDLG